MCVDRYLRFYFAVRCFLLISSMALRFAYNGKLAIDQFHLLTIRRVIPEEDLLASIADHTILYHTIPDQSRDH